MKFRRESKETKRVPLTETWKETKLLKIVPLDTPEYVHGAFIIFSTYNKETHEYTWQFRNAGLDNLEELLGALRIQTRILEDKLASEWEH